MATNEQERRTSKNQPEVPRTIDDALLNGDLSALTPSQRSEYYQAVCKSLGLNPLTKPFEYLNLNGKLRLYALRDCADQLRRLHGISIYIANRERISDIYVVTARAKDRSGREDESTGAVPLKGLMGDAMANALMKAETKAKRRVTLSIAGLGFLDEVELDSIPGAVVGEPGLHSGVVEHPNLVNPEDEHPTADEVTTLVELSQSCGVDIVSFGHYCRQVMQLSGETKVTKKFLRESMTMAQYIEVWQHYAEVLQQQVEQGAADPFPLTDTRAQLFQTIQASYKSVMGWPPARKDAGFKMFREAFGIETMEELAGLDTPTLGSGYQHLQELLAATDEPMPEIEDLREPVTDQTPEGGARQADNQATTAAESGLRATPAMIEELKQLAAKVREDARPDIQDMLDHFPHGISLDCYQQVKQQLQWKLDEAKPVQAAVEVQA